MSNLTCLVWSPRVPQEGPAELAMLVDFCLNPDPVKRPTSAKLVQILTLMQ